jgi:hypothetical protein
MSVRECAECESAETKARGNKMRAAIVNGRHGVIAAQGSAQNAGKVFVLFNDDDVNESAAGWFPADVAVPTVDELLKLIG